MAASFSVLTYHGSAVRIYLRCRLERFSPVRTRWSLMTLLSPVSSVNASHIQDPPFLIIFLGGSAVAAGELVAKQGGKTVEYLFIIEALFLNARAKLDAPVYSIIQVEDDTPVDSGRETNVCGAMYWKPSGGKGRASGP